jgi:8-oxo-dGTP pyrophosphatase MutT (NUDIX family)
MLDHHIQRSIVYKLALNSTMRFSELKPGDIESKLFTYHLKKVVSAGFVEKTPEGLYCLTPEGRRLGIHAIENGQALVDQAYSVLFLVIRRKSDGAWLLCRRKSHPLIDRFGFMHCVPNALEESVLTAQNECMNKSGITAEFTALGGGYFRVFEQSRLESFTHFTLLICETAEGEIVTNDKHAEYYWADSIDLDDPSLLPTMPKLLECYRSKQQFFIEEQLSV